MNEWTPSFGKIPTFNHKNFRDVAQPGSAHVWGAWGRKFESCHPDSYVLKPLLSKGFIILEKIFSEFLEQLLTINSHIGAFKHCWRLNSQQKIFYAKRRILVYLSRLDYSG